MALISKLSIPVGADLKPLAADLKAAGDELQGFADSAVARVKLGAEGGGGSPMAAAPIDTGEMAMHLRSAITSGLMPLKSMGPTLGQEFNALGGTITTMFRRIDAAMKFPAINNALKGTADSLQKSAERLGAHLVRNKIEAERNAAAFAKLPPILQESAREMGLLAERETYGSAIAAKLLAPWSALKSRVAEARAEMDRAAMKPPPAGQRPGVGRAIQVSGGRADLGVVVRSAAAVGKALDEARKRAEVFAVGYEKIGPIARDVGASIVNAFKTGGAAIALAGAGIADIGRGIVRWRNWTSSLGDVAGKTYSDIVREHGLIKTTLAAPITSVKALANTMLRVGTLGFLGRHAGDAARFGANVKTSRGQVQALSGSVGGLAKNMLAAFGFIGITFKIADFFKSGIKGAVNLNETVNVTNETFGDSSKKVQEFASGMSRSFGFSKREILDTANSFGAIAQGVGVAEGESASFSRMMTKLTADAVSFKNVDLGTAAEKIRSGITGEMQPLKEWGIVINENMVKAEAARLGLDRSSRGFDEHAKMMARVSLISRGLGAAQGDLERTSDSAANQFRKAGGGLENFAVMIGEMLMPAVNVGVQAFNSLLASVIELFENSQPTIASWASYLTAAMEGVGSLVRNFGLYWKIATLRVGEFTANTVAYLDFLPQNFERITTWLRNNWFNLLGDFIEGAAALATNLTSAFMNLGKAIWEAFKGGSFEFDWNELFSKEKLLAGFRPMTEAFPEMMHGALIDVSEEVDGLFAEIQKKDAALKKGPAAARKKMGLPETPAIDKGPKFASLAELGSKEAYSAVIKGRTGPGRDGPIKDLGKTARESLKVQQDTLAEQRKKSELKLAIYNF